VFHQNRWPNKKVTAKNNFGDTNCTRREASAAPPHKLLGSCDKVIIGCNFRDTVSIFIKHTAFFSSRDGDKEDDNKKVIGSIFIFCINMNVHPCHSLNPIGRRGSSIHGEADHGRSKEIIEIEQL